MTAKHRDPEFIRNARIVRAQVKRARRMGAEVCCWRCGIPLEQTEPFDVGHVHPDGGPGLDNLAPEHRHRTGRCRGNRSAGGQLGAAITNGQRARRATSTRSAGLLRWSIAVLFADRCSPRLRLPQPSLPLNLEAS